MTQPTCHPDRPYYAQDRCASCYVAYVTRKDYVPTHTTKLGAPVMFAPDAREELKPLAVFVRQRRTELGLSMEAFARKCGLSNKPIYRLEHATASPRQLTLEAIALGLNCKIDDLPSPSI